MFMYLGFLPCLELLRLLYSKNVLNFLKLIIDKDGNLNLDYNDDIVAGTCITRDGNIVNERVLSIVNPQTANA